MDMAHGQHAGPHRSFYRVTKQEIRGTTNHNDSLEFKQHTHKKMVEYECNNYLDVHLKRDDP